MKSPTTSVRFYCLVALAALFAPAFLPPVARADVPAVSSDPLKGLGDWLAQPRENRPQLTDRPFAGASLTRDQAARARRLLWDDHVAAIRADREKEWNDQAITIGEHTLRFKSRRFGDKPEKGWSLYISMHGGGNAPAQVNDQQWQNQIRLYQLKEGIYIAPRAPTNTWNLWHEAHIDDLFDRLLDDAFVLADVNPNRVYIMGYSAGGDGVYQLAPRMADRWAAAAMMAGHPNDASPLGLRNIGFTIHVGGRDFAYNRNKVAVQWGKLLDDLRAQDPQGYVHKVVVHENLAHWMNREDVVAIDWMAGFTRDPLPAKVVWKQSTVTHDRFYWLAVPPGQSTAGSLVIAERKQQEIELEKVESIGRVTVMLSDAMLDLDRPLTITMNGRELFKGKVPRTIATLQSTLAARGDPFLAFDAAITVPLNAQAN